MIAGTTGNTWYYNLTGNFYSDYQIQNPGATNDRRVWNEPYIINGSAADKDNYPLAEPYGYIPFVVTGQPILPTL